MATILEALQNAQYNICEASPMTIFQFETGKSQLTNAVILLEKGYPLSTEVEPFTNKYISLKYVPDYKEETPLPIPPPPPKA